MAFNETDYSETEQTLTRAVKRAGELGIKSIVIASCTGATVKKILELTDCNNLNLVCVTHQIGFTRPGEDEMDPEIRKALESEGVKVLTATHLFAGVDRALRFKFQGVYPAEMIAGTLRIFGQGIKVGIEIVCMALDAGLIPYGEDVISVGGTESGADSALVVRPAHSQNFFETKVIEVIRMSRG